VDADGLGADERAWPICRLVRPSATSVSTRPHAGSGRARSPGLSMGGYVCFELARQAPDRVARLALLDTTARPDTPS
jgi:pimeloyl-ACP methyl ester carboxylesterase